MRKLNNSMSIEEYKGPINSASSQSVEGIEPGFRQDRLSKEDRERIENNAFKFNGVDFREGEQVIYHGKLYSVVEFVGGGISTEVDRSLDPYGRITKEVPRRAALGLGAENAEDRIGMIYVGEGEMVEKATPEALKRLQDRDKRFENGETNQQEQQYTPEELEAIAKSIQWKKIDMGTFKIHDGSPESIEKPSTPN